MAEGRRSLLRTMQYNDDEGTYSLDSVDPKVESVWRDLLHNDNLSDLLVVWCLEKKKFLLLEDDEGFGGGASEGNTTVFS